ncbi:MAG TPA: amino acid adenylation domain-containing protein [Opitutaceae bacterium]|nr:amino acid adenylation domain-containing protein [Opitutaceae bacterium]
MVRDSKVNPLPGLDSYPLSALQQGMLFHSLERRDRGVDVEQVIGELHEEIQPAQFERAWREMLARHAILRTSFHWDDDEPRQVVHGPADARLPFRYAEFGSAIEARRGLEEYLAADRDEGFELHAAPLIRVALLRGGPAHYWCVLTFHHVLLDGRALVVLFREVFELHDALVAGHKLELPPPRSYRLYIDWLKRRDNQRAEKFWRERLRGFTTPTLVPLPAPARETRERGALRGELAARLPATTTTALRATAQRHGVTVNTLMHGAWAVVLSRYSGEDDVMFGAVRACRHVPIEDAGSIVGLFINTAPVRVSVGPATRVGEWLRGLREQWVALREHEHTSLAQIQQWSELAPGRPLFETLLNYQEPSWDTALTQLGGNWSRREFDIRGQPNYPLALDACGGATIALKLLYDRGRFDDEAMARLLGHLRILLEALATDASATVGELSMLTAAERRQLLVDWNRTRHEFPQGACVHELFEAEAKNGPTRLAVADADTSLTYGLLNRRANRLARRLQSLGIGPEKTVAVAMERSVEMIVAWLAVAKAGGALVSLDPAAPRERLEFQLRDCGASVAIMPSRLRAILPVLDGVTMLDLSGEGSAFALESELDLPRNARAENLAYVIYTSGSTGQPKGVLVEHRSLANLVAWHRRAYEITPQDRATQLASPAFDAAIWEIWPYLAAGASVHVVDDATRVDPARLVRWLAEKKITLTFLPTPLAEATMSESWPQGAALRAILTGGDRLKRRPPAGFPCALVNHYGPTENTVVATSTPVAPGADAEAPAIGRPIANTRAFVLDAHGRLVPIGVPGELYLGGTGLARGYLNQTELTAEKFRSRAAESSGEKSDEFSSSSPRAERLYRTGDRVRWRASGELEFLGRRDGQVKVRGHRVELGEIEAALRRHPAARESLVLARNDAFGQALLVAYVLRSDDAATVNGAELATFLRSTLPAYMVPAHFVFVAAWPLTLNGKIDREALPAPSGRATETRAPFEAPRSPLEETIATAWANVLGRAAIGRHDHFFELGGHSLLAAQVVSRLSRALGVTLSVRVIFDHPQFADLARELGRLAEQAPLQRVPLRRVVRSEDAGLVLVQPD